MKIPFVFLLLFLMLKADICPQLRNASGTTINIKSGTYLVLGGNFTNSGTLTAQSGSTVAFRGSAIQTISGTGSETLQSLTINNSSGLSLSSNISINGSLTLTAGNIQTNSNTIYFGSSATDPMETSSAKIIGTASMNSRAVGTGTLSFLGANITGNSDIGNVAISRVTGSSGVISNSGNNSIQSSWTFTAGGTTPYANRSLTLTWLSSFDNGKTFSAGNKAQVWTSTNGGTSWSTLGSSSDVSGSNPRSISNAVTSLLKFTVIDASSPLPVELLSINAAQVNQSVEIKWKTAQEINNYGFEIERKSQKSEWEMLGFVKGHGSSRSPREFSFTDNQPPAGRTQYRLKQIDNDGQFKYYDALSIDVNAPREYCLMQNSPNPFNPSTAIKFQLPMNTFVSVKVYDMLGREITSLINEEKPAGSHIVYWNGRDMNGQMVSSGVYLYKLTAGTYTETRKMNLLK
ncbi:MAG: T9SS type A sorting domain-containing protein [Bacteroidota bacterium]|nr:T9SS type A sorting domain-containing protein [Bacteroidota bacterium]